jgi:hypothetical protein
MVRPHPSTAVPRGVGASLAPAEQGRLRRHAERARDGWGGPGSPRTRVPVPQRLWPTLAGTCERAGGPSHGTLPTRSGRTREPRGQPAVEPGPPEAVRRLGAIDVAQRPRRQRGAFGEGLLQAPGEVLEGPGAQRLVQVRALPGRERPATGVPAQQRTQRAEVDPPACTVSALVVPRSWKRWSSPTRSQSRTAATRAPRKRTCSRTSSWWQAPRGWSGRAASSGIATCAAASKSRSGPEEWSERGEGHPRRGPARSSA